MLVRMTKDEGRGRAMVSVDLGFEEGEAWSWGDVVRGTE